MGALSRAFSTICLAAAAIPADVFALVVGVSTDGLSGSGGGARAGSELSHLRLRAVSKGIVGDVVSSHVYRACVQQSGHNNCIVLTGSHSHGHAGSAIDLTPGMLSLMACFAVARAFPIVGRHYAWWCRRVLV